MWGLKGKLFRKAPEGAPQECPGFVASGEGPGPAAPVKGSGPEVPAETDTILRYTGEVCSQIRCQRARPYIEKELADHIADRMRSLTGKGMPEEEALKRAIADMGDAVIVGQELDRVHRPRIEWGILLLMGVMLCIGAFVQHYLSAMAAEDGWAGQEAFSNYMTTLPVGIIVLLAVYFADYTLLGKYPKQIYAGILLLCAVPSLMGGRTIVFNILDIYIGHSNWLGIASALLLLPVYAGLLYRYRNSGYGGILKCGGAAGLALLVLYHSQRTWFGTLGLASTIFAFGGLVLISAAIAKGWFRVAKGKALTLVYAPTLLCLLGLFLVKLWRYGTQRDVFLEGIKGMFLASQDTLNGFWGLYAREIVKNARLIGQGEVGIPGVDSPMVMKGFLPSWWSDFSLTYLIHQWGLIAAVISLALFAFLLVKMLGVVLKQKNALGFMVSLSVVAAIGIQCVLFFTANLGICFFGILPLPLMTMGRISFLVNMALIGLLLSAYRNLDIVRDMAAGHEKAGKGKEREKRKISRSVEGGI